MSRPSFVLRPAASIAAVPARRAPRALTVTASLVLAACLTACSGDATGPTEHTSGSSSGTGQAPVTPPTSGPSGTPTTTVPTPAAAPTITLTVQGATMATGGACLVFYAKSAEDLVVFTGKLEDPLQHTYRVDPVGGTSFVMGQGRLTTLQPAGTCYPKLSGNYTFTFTGTRAGGGAFTATATYNQPSV